MIAYAYGLRVRILTTGQTAIVASTTYDDRGIRRIRCIDPQTGHAIGSFRAADLAVWSYGVHD